MVIAFSVFFMFDHVFFLRQVKQSMIISNKHDIYRLPYKLLIKDHRKLGNIRKI